MRAGLAVLGLVVLAEAALLVVGVDDLDEGYFAQQALRLLHGQVPFRDFSTLYSPGLLTLHAALLGLFGGPPLIVLRVVALAARAGVAFVLFAIGRPLLRRAWLAAAPGVFLLLALDDAPLRWEPHPGWPSALFAALAAWCLVRPPARRWLVAAAASAAAAYAFKQNTGAFMLGAVLLRAAWPRERSAAGRIGIVLATFGILTGLWLAPLLVAVDGSARDLGVLIGAVNQAGLFSPPELPLLIPLACAAAGLWLVRGGCDPRLTWLLVSALALGLTEYPRMDALHLVWSAPLLLVLGAIGLDRLRPPIAAVAGLAAVALCLPTLIGRVAYVSQPRAPVAGVSAPIQTAADLNGAVAEISARTAPGEPIFVYPSSPLLYVLADRPNPTRFDHLNPGAASPSDIQAVIGTLEAARVRLVIISEFWRLGWGPPHANAPLETWLDAHYIDAARYGPYRVLVPRL